MIYIEETWLAHKEKFVSAFLLGKLHFGHTTTSRLDSAHCVEEVDCCINRRPFDTVKACFSRISVIHASTSSDQE
ncbi:unnamed protein product [Albugo candida]|uniref:Uncharacterized protein n=1 Tax=Albugo candida TaxID=65357 RepID=A0A024GPH6_9STRA|nr:unnamed protein product [Albugo candida]|eukprot:CCI48792.1 unnamed protein product [Albugo candida]